jgi:hypothetical protein
MRARAVVTSPIANDSALEFRILGTLDAHELWGEWPPDTATKVSLIPVSSTFAAVS